MILPRFDPELEPIPKMNFADLLDLILDTAYEHFGEENPFFAFELERLLVSLKIRPELQTLYMSIFEVLPSLTLTELEQYHQDLKYTIICDA